MLSVVFFIFRFNSFLNERYDLAEKRIDGVAPSGALSLYTLNIQQADSILLGFSQDVLFHSVQLTEPSGLLLTQVENDSLKVELPPWLQQLTFDHLEYRIEKPLFYSYSYQNKPTQIHVGNITASLNEAVFEVDPPEKDELYNL